MEPSLKRKRFLLLGTAAIVVVALAVLYLLGSVLLTLGLSAVIAYVLLPVAKLMERGMPWRRNHPDLARGISVGIIFLVGLGVFAGLIIAVVPPTVEQGQRFIENFPNFLNNARVTIEGWVAQYADLVPPELRDQAEEGLAGAGNIVGAAAWNVAKQTLGVITGSFAFVLGLATAPRSGLLPNEGLRTHSRVPSRALSKGGPPPLERHPGHCRPDPGWVHSRSTHLGRNRRCNRCRWPPCN